MYVFRDVENHSETVALSNISDNFGSYWGDLYQKLRKERSRNNVRAWVNPSNPSESFLDRTFRWGNVAFGSLFF